jgi:hypothetical protein
VDELSLKESVDLQDTVSLITKGHHIDKGESMKGR